MNLGVLGVLGGESPEFKQSWQDNFDQCLRRTAPKLGEHVDGPRRVISLSDVVAINRRWRSSQFEMVSLDQSERIAIVTSDAGSEVAVIDLAWSTSS